MHISVTERRSRKGVFSLPRLVPHGLASEARFAFFTEAIFLGIYLYGWNRVSPVLHWLAGIVVAVSGVLSAVFVVFANAWMNTPVGFDVVNGQPTNIHPIAAMLSPASLHETIHMVLAAYVATAFLVAGIHAFFLLPPVIGGIPDDATGKRKLHARNPVWVEHAGGLQSRN